MAYRIPAALRNTDGAVTGNSVTLRSSAANSDITAGAFFAWVMATNVSNSYRVIASKFIAGPGGWEASRDSVDGTKMNFARYRTAGNALNMLSPTGYFVANVPTFICATWDITTPANSKLYRGALDTPASDVGATLTNGSGSPVSDVSRVITVTNSFSGSHGWPGIVWAIGLSSTSDHTLADIRRVQYQMTPRAIKSCVGLWTFDQRPVFDQSGNGNVGTFNGSATLSSDNLPRVRRVEMVA